MSKTADNKAVRSLAAQSRRQLVFLGLVIFIGLVTLVAGFSFYQIDQAMDNYLRLEASKLELEVQADPYSQINRSPDLNVFNTWEDIPNEFRKLFLKQEALSGVVLEAERMNSRNEKEYVYLMFSNTLNLGGLYILDIEAASTIDALLKTIVEQTVVEASLVIGGFIIIFFLIIAWIFRHAIRPLNLLVDWSKSLKQHPNQELSVNFSIQELNDIAEHLLDSLTQIREFNEREQQFLKHASHELRTPLAIIQASIDTLQVRTPTTHPSHSAVQRASRASSNMILLTEALLWLSRQSTDEVQLNYLYPGNICRELIEDMRYLIEGRSITIELADHSKEIAIQKDLFRIVSANLIRNAFQHSASGVIVINVEENELVIKNPIDDDTLPSEPSFGLGLQLVERIAKKLNWDFEFQVIQNQARVRLSW